MKTLLFKNTPPEKINMDNLKNSHGVTTVIMVSYDGKDTKILYC
ncbi:MAG: hypothetical protein ACRCZB_05510 [Bacteroidales bacterium]